jgi:tetratricopeptide (TPR) repeat protein/predicted Ser/Thr protein kinase
MRSRSTDSTASEYRTGSIDTFLREAARMTSVPLAGAPPVLTPGMRLSAGRFEVTRRLGEGGMGVVLAAHDHQLDCPVALKTVRVPSLESLRRLRGEFVALHDLVHPHLVTLGELCEDGGLVFFSMELVDGGDFLQHVRPDGRLDAARLRVAVRQLVDALFHLHAAGIVHRDIKPSNVLVTDGRVVVLDFGLASTSERAGIDGAGTPAYMAPEQVGGGLVGPSADVFAVGVMVWEAITGELPFAGSRAELVEARRRGPDPSALDGAPPDLAALALALLEPSPARRPSHAELAARLGLAVPTHHGPPPFVGRDAELAALAAAWSAARERMVTVLVRGPSGVGKSMLTHHFAATAAEQGALVVAGRCYERMAIPHKALHGVATALAAHARRDGDVEAALLSAPDVALLPASFPVLAEVPSLARIALDAPPVSDPQEMRARVFHALRDALRAVAACRPMIVILDDLQWGDRDGLRLLEHVVSGEGAPFLLIAIARDGALPDDARWLIGDGAREIVVPPLAPADAEALVRALDGDGDGAASIAREAAGHPLHIVELVRHAGGDRTARPRLDDAIGARVATLPAEPASLLRLVALAGLPLPQAVLREAADLDGAAFWHALGWLRAGHLIRTGGPRDDDPIEAYHDRVRESVVASLDEPARSGGHARLAAALTEHPIIVDRPELLVDHLEGAGEPERAAVWAERAADHARDALAFERAAELYQRALALGQPDPAAEVVLHTRVGDAFVAAGRGARAAEAFVAAAARASGDDALELRRRAAEHLIGSGRVDDGLEVIDGVLGEVGLPTVTPRRFPILSLLGQRLLLAVRRWSPPIGKDQRQTQRRIACCWSAFVGLSLADPLRAAEYHARYYRLALGAGDPHAIALGTAFEAMQLSVPGPPARRAFALLAETERLAAAHGGPSALAYARMARGVVEFVTGRWSAALESCDRAERTFRDERVGSAWELGTMQQMAQSCLLHMGRMGELRRRAARAVEDADQRGDLYTSTQLRTVALPYVHLMEDRVDLARADLARAAQDLPKKGVHAQHWQHAQAMVLVELWAGDPEAALAHMEQHVPLVQRALLFRISAVRAFATVSSAATHLALAARGGRHADRWLRRAEVDRRRLRRNPFKPALADFVGAQIALLRGDRAAARRRFERAAVGLAATDMGLLARIARWRLGELIGGDEGARQVAAIHAEMLADGSVRPVGGVDLFAPVRP